jgi:hypothetical protein
MASQIATYWVEQCQGALKYPAQTNVVWLELAASTEVLAEARKRKLDPNMWPEDHHAPSLVTRSLPDLLLMNRLIGSNH